MVAGLLAGAWLINRNAPHSSVEKRSILGTRTGRVYECDEFPDTGIVIVHDPQYKAQVAFQRVPNGFVALKCRGPRQAVSRILYDIQGPQPKEEQKKPPVSEVKFG